MSSLADHRIEQVTPFSIRTRYPRAVGRNARLGSHGSGPQTTAVRLTTDQGAAGWGVAQGPVDGTEALVGRAVADLFDPATGVTDPAAHSLDIALHDLAGVITGTSVAQMLGGAGERDVTCYSGAIYFDDLDPQDSPRGLDAVMANCAADWDAGFRAFKLKIGRGSVWMEHEAGLRRDIEVTRAVREAYPEARIMVDANDGYSPRLTVEFLKQVADCHLFWIEEPFAETVAGLTVLREYLHASGSSVRVADGEFRPDVPQLLDLVEKGLLDVLLMDVVSYGLTPWRAIMPTLVELGVQTSPHAWGMPLKTLYATQMSAGLGNVLTVEGVPGGTDDVDTSAYRLVDGVITVPQAPGFAIPVPAI